MARTTGHVDDFGDNRHDRGDLSDDSSQAEDEVVDLCQELLRIDTTNPGDGTGPGERAAAEKVMGWLTEVGLDPALVESDPGRASVMVRVPGPQQQNGAQPQHGARADRGALLVHGHLDVVPAQAADWSVPPFAGEISEGCLWGRGAVDMKDMVAMMLAVIRHGARTGWVPPRDIVFAFFADEEAGGARGSHWLVDHHPEWFSGVTEAVSEVGGFSIDVDGQRCYLIQSAEKGMAWLRLVAHGRAGHGSQINDDNAVTRLSEAVARIGGHRWPLEVTPTVRAFLEGVTEITGVRFDPDNPDEMLDRLGTTARWVGATLRNTANPTALQAGYKHNVIPGTAAALLDCRFLPDREQDLMATVRELAGPHIEVQTVHRDVALQAPHRGPLHDAMAGALLAEDPGAQILPYCLSGGTDNKAMSRLGITGYGFAPLRLPPHLDFSGMFHGIDERVPLDALPFGVRVLNRFLRTC